MNRVISLTNVRKVIHYHSRMSHTLPRTVQAAVMTGPHQPIVIQEFPMPELPVGGILLKTMMSEVCGTDIHIHHGRLSGVTYPIIPGHVSCGVIAAIRGNQPINDIHDRPFKEGDIVTFLDVAETCYSCYYCSVVKQITRCPHRKVYGVTYSCNNGGLFGGWSQYIQLVPGTKLLRLPDNLDPVSYCGGGCGLNTAIHSVDRADIQLGDNVAVLGVGPVGQSVVAFARLSGAARVLAIDSESDRLEFARQMGATHTFNLRENSHHEENERIKEINKLSDSGYGFDVCIECAGNPTAVRDSLLYARDGGRVVITGQYTDVGSIEINPHQLINKKHIQVRGCWGSDFSHFYRALELQSKYHTQYPWKRMIGKTFQLSEINEAMKAVAERSLVKAAIAPNGTDWF
jgi:D-arabinose 1-dehydrogenase-like Zn-dependent alcohol dehydrogenase